MQSQRLLGDRQPSAIATWKTLEPQRAAATRPRARVDEPDAVARRSRTDGRLGADATRLGGRRRAATRRARVPPCARAGSTRPSALRRAAAGSCAWQPSASATRSCWSWLSTFMSRPASRWRTERTRSRNSSASSSRSPSGASRGANASRRERAQTAGPPRCRAGRPAHS